MDPGISTPRFVTCINQYTEDGNVKEYSWKPDKIHVEQYLADDMLMLQNVFEGMILSPSIYPLIYESKNCQKETGLRSLEFFREVDQNHNLYNALAAEEKLYFLIGVRDLFVASCRDLLSEEEKELLRRIVNIIDPKGDDQDIIIKYIDGISVTPYPTAKNKMVRFVAAANESVSDECFIRNELNLLMVFVDPRDLSYHNLENIINLNSLFQKNPPEFIISSDVEKHPEHEVYGFEMTDKTKILLSLDNYGLYTQPLNKLSRGGERFIFSSEKLSQSLTECIKTFIQNQNSQLITPKFRFVNYVFRYNKFRPGDHKFTSHYDTPYYDPVKKHYSKYTIILYLTSGTADPVLSLNKGNVNITQIDTKGQIRGVIFDQKYEHEGRSFVERDKIFLRSELVFEFDDTDGLTFDADISKKFNIACYMTKQSLFNEELERYACECFNQVAEARLNLAKAQITDDYLLRKTFEGMSFITNGYDYWFQNNISLKDAAVLALLDHFNGKFDSPSGKYFNSLTYDEIVKLNVESMHEIFEYMTQAMRQDEQKGKMETEITASNTQFSQGIKNGEFDEEHKQDNNYNSKQGNKTKQKLYYTEELQEKMEMEGVEDWNLFKYNYHNNILFEAEDATDEDYLPPENDDKVKVEDDNDSESDDNRESDEEEQMDLCCNFHSGSYDFDPKRCWSIVWEAEKRQLSRFEKLERLKENFVIMIFGSEIEIKKSSMVITDKAIIFDEKIPKINFAACWNGEYDKTSYIGTENKYITAYANIPPIPYRVYENGYHLKIELFNNSFVRKHNDGIKNFFLVKEPHTPRSLSSGSDDNDAQDSDLDEDTECIL